MSNDFAALSAEEECCMGGYLLLNTIGRGPSAERRLARHIFISTEVAARITSQWGFSVVVQRAQLL